MYCKNQQKKQTKAYIISILKGKINYETGI
ncbi:hypothetical protein MTsPCn9_16810 [Croceitalea sp. MTPC9]|nr:hypothetical protein MTsPCn6_09660 [Croceitalea sp. MTPC6]GMN16745.1 hypothetical protein MTsPCn9_16810 [Croceitalea sp. MTPC9]